MTKYLETKKNSIEEAIKGVVLEKKLDPVNKVQSRRSLMIEKTKTSTMMVMLILQTSIFTKDVKQYQRR